jgi:hypothetical protein
LTGFKLGPPLLDDPDEVGRIFNKVAFLRAASAATSDLTEASDMPPPLPPPPPPPLGFG